MNTNQTENAVRWLGWIILAAGVLVAGWSLLSEQPDSLVASPNVDVSQLQQASHAGSLDSFSASRATATRNIEDLRVGDRVMAHNPEVSDEERATWTEPDWNSWLKLTLKMPKEDGSVLSIQILRPEDWLLQQVGYVVDQKQPVASEENGDSYLDETLDRQWQETSYWFTSKWNNAPDDVNQQRSLGPVRSYLYEFASIASACDQAGVELVGLTVEMDLAEMGAVGAALITDIEACPQVLTGNGQPVTATFSHPPSDAVLDVVFEGETTPISVTDNHLFWSVDRQEFLAIGEMEIGERVQTFQGDTKRIESKLPRPGPEVVYNLEVYGEHVYFVGEQGLLAHNTYNASESGFTGQFGRLDPNDIRFSQTTAGGRGRAAQLRESMGRNGFNGPAVDAVQTPDGIVTLDNTRIAIARELGIPEVPVKIRLPSDRLPDSMLGRFGDAQTFGEALIQRTSRQRPPLGPTGTPTTPRLPNN